MVPIDRPHDQAPSGLCLPVPDVFYYLVIARNHHEMGMWSFDGEHPTNGYHPLWQWLLGPFGPCLLGLTQRPDCPGASSDRCGSSRWSAGYALRRAEPCPTPDPAGRADGAGITALASTPLYQSIHDREAFRDPLAARPIFTTMWSFANGMETPLLIFAFSASVLFIVRHPRLESNFTAIHLAILLLALTFSRLDHVFFAAALLMAVLAPAWRDQDRQTLWRGLGAAAVLGGGIIAYMVGNQIAYGVSLPISGVYKSHFPRISLATLQLLGQKLSDPGDQWLVSGARLFQLLFPMVVATAFLPLKLRLNKSAPFIELRPGSDRLDSFLCWTALAVLTLGLYNTFFVLLIQTGPWYFPLSTLFVSIALISTLDRLRVVRLFSATPQRAVAIAGLLSLGVSAYFIRAQYSPLYLADHATFYYDEAPRIREYYRARGEVPKLVEFDDGIVSFATGFPSMSGHGLALDKEAMIAKKHDQLMHLALERGYDHVASLDYVQLRDPGPLRSSDAWSAYKWIKKEERRSLRFVPEYHAPEIGFAIFAVELRDPEDET